MGRTVKVVSTLDKRRGHWLYKNFTVIGLLLLKYAINLTKLVDCINYLMRSLRLSILLLFQT